MARLNEAPLPTESIDVLKRRFIRQNRDLAKVNSTQSLRIRALECDITRLNSENLNLREENLRLQSQLSASHSAVHTAALEDAKTQLQAKLEELGSLIVGLGLSDKPQREKRIPDPTSWKPAVPRAHLVHHESRLPIIVEGKNYPRRTLEPDEVFPLRLSDQYESPDLGPPPVAHFECDEPIKFDARMQTQAQVGDTTEVEDIPADLAVNLETRKRRRDIGGKVNGRRSSIFADSAEETEPVRSLKASAKRDASASDGDVATTAGVKDFTFSRKTANGNNVLGGDEDAATLEAKSTETVDSRVVNVGHAPLEVAKRRVLGNKSVNMSPKKRVISSKGLEELPEKKDERLPKTADTTTARARKPKIVSVPSNDQAAEPVVQSVSITNLEPLAPLTPAPDLFSPMISEPSTLRVDGRDTPPPGHLSGSDTDGNGGRPSRRARAAVSYKQPSLNTKMRRPTKELVSAVYVPGKATLNDQSAPRSEDRTRTVLIKREDSTKDDWKNLPSARLGEQASPLGKMSGSKVALDDVTAGLDITFGKRGVSGLPDAKESQEKNKSDSRKASPADCTTNANATSRPVTKRRHSSVSAASIDSEGSHQADSGSSSPAMEAKGIEIKPLRRSASERESSLQGFGRSERAATRRRSMMI